MTLHAQWRKVTETWFDYQIGGVSFAYLRRSNRKGLPWIVVNVTIEYGNGCTTHRDIQSAIDYIQSRTESWLARLSPDIRLAHPSEEPYIGQGG